MDPESGLIKPLSVFNSVVLPAPLRPIRPRHSPRRSSKETLFTAQNSSGRKPEESWSSGEIGVRSSEMACGSATLSSNYALPSPFFPNGFRSEQMSCTPYQSDLLRSRQNFLETP